MLEDAASSPVFPEYVASGEIPWENDGDPAAGAGLRSRSFGAPTIRFTECPRRLEVDPSAGEATQRRNGAETQSPHPPLAEG